MRYRIILIWHPYSAPKKNVGTYYSIFQRAPNLTVAPGSCWSSAKRRCRPAVTHHAKSVKVKTRLSVSPQVTAQKLAANDPESWTYAARLAACRRIQTRSTAEPPLSILGATHAPQQDTRGLYLFSKQPPPFLFSDILLDKHYFNVAHGCC